MTLTEKPINVPMEKREAETMAGADSSRLKSYVAILMGIVIAAADVYWTYTSYFYTLWLVLGIVIFIADVIWLAIDYGFLRSTMTKSSLSMRANTK